MDGDLGSTVAAFKCGMYTLTKSRHLIGFLKGLYESNSVDSHTVLHNTELRSMYIVFYSLEVLKRLEYILELRSSPRVSPVFLSPCENVLPASVSYSSPNYNSVLL